MKAINEMDSGEHVGTMVKSKKACMLKASCMGMVGPYQKKEIITRESGKISSSMATGRMSRETEPWKKGSGPTGTLLIMMSGNAERFIV